jgi:hypothetical protein
MEPTTVHEMKRPRILPRCLCFNTLPTTPLILTTPNTGQMWVAVGEFLFTIDKIFELAGPTVAFSLPLFVRVWSPNVLHHCTLLDKAYHANVCSHSGGKSRLHDQMGSKTTLEMQYLGWRHILRSLYNPTNEHSFYYGVVRWACISDRKGNDVHRMKGFDITQNMKHQN